jgi:hypothetical protein
MQHHWSEAKDDEGNMLLTFSMKVAELQIQQGCFFCMEHPDGASSWKDYKRLVANMCVPASQFPVREASVPHTCQWCQAPGPDSPSSKLNCKCQAKWLNRRPPSKPCCCRSNGSTIAEATVVLALSETCTCRSKGSAGNGGTCNAMKSATT